MPFSHPILLFRQGPTRTRAIFLKCKIQPWFKPSRKIFFMQLQKVRVIILGSEEENVLKIARKSPNNMCSLDFAWLDTRFNIVPNNMTLASLFFLEKKAFNLNYQKTFYGFDLAGHMWSFHIYCHCCPLPS